MKSIDQEWRELTELYSQMSEGELQALANEAYDLTDMARDVLRGEISRRGLHMQLQDQPAPTEVGQNHAPPSAEFDPAELDLVPFGRVFDIDEARRIKSIFENGGVLSYFGPDHVENVEELKAAFDAEKAESLKRGFEVGIEYSVPRKYRDQAFRVRANAAQETPADADPADDVDLVALCPRCHASDITFQSLETEEGADPDVDSKYNWSCDACGYQWKDDGVEEEGKVAFPPSKNHGE